MMDLIGKWRVHIYHIFQGEGKILKKNRSSFFPSIIFVDVKHVLSILNSWVVSSVVVTFTCEKNDVSTRMKFFCHAYVLCPLVILNQDESVYLGDNLPIQLVKKSHFTRRKNLQVQLCKLYSNKHIIVSTQTTNTEVFPFIAVLVFKLLSRKFLFINRKDNRNCLKSRLFFETVGMVVQFAWLYL